MKKKNNIAVKLLAIFALFGIIISIIGTALLVITSNNSYETDTISVDQLQDLIDTDNIQFETKTASGETEVNIIESEETWIIRGVED